MMRTPATMQDAVKEAARKARRDPWTDEQNAILMDGLAEGVALPKLAAGLVKPNIPASAGSRRSQRPWASKRNDPLAHPRAGQAPPRPHVPREHGSHRRRASTSSQWAVRPENEDYRMSNDTAPALLRQYAERIGRLNDEKKGLQSDITEVYAEAHSQGFDKKGRIHGVFRNGHPIIDGRDHRAE